MSGFRRLVHKQRWLWYWSFVSAKLFHTCLTPPASADGGFFLAGPGVLWRVWIVISNCSVCKKPCDETNSFTSIASVTVHFECFDVEIAKTPDDPRPNWFIIFGSPLIISTLTAGACFFQHHLSQQPTLYILFLAFLRCLFSFLWALVTVQVTEATMAEAVEEVVVEATNPTSDSSNSALSPRNWIRDRFVCLGLSRLLLLDTHFVAGFNCFPRVTSSSASNLPCRGVGNKWHCKNLQDQVASCGAPHWLW